MCITDESATRRRRRRILNPNDILTSLTENGRSSSSASNSARVTPLLSPSTSSTLTSSPRGPVPISSPTLRRSDLSVHMENARRGVTSSDSSTTNTKARTPTRRLFTSSPRQKSDSDKKKSTSSEQEDFQSFSDRDLRSRRAMEDERSRRTSSSDNKFVTKSKRLSGDYDKVRLPADNEPINSARKLLTESDRSTRRMPSACTSRTNDVSKRMDNLAALTKDTLARVEKLRTQPPPRRDSIPVDNIRKKSASRSPEKILKPTNITATRLVVASELTPPGSSANIEKGNGNINANHQIREIADGDHQNHNGYHEDISKPSSILKKSFEDTPVVIIPPPSVQIQGPVSILKRKSSQDEAGSSNSASSSFATPPVTFSPTVIDPVPARKKPGILKKRCSLDESHVIRRRSYSPDVALVEGSSDYRPILKNQRRSSLEELVRTRSPDFQPQGILKRKHSRGEDEFGERSLGSPEPQSILKRKSGTSSSGSSGNSPHVSIATAVILAAAGGAEIVLEPVKPILKKKSFSDENPTMDTLNPEVPKPILKKKSSTETDEQDDRPMKPILKTSRKYSQEDNFASRENNEYGLDSPRIHSVLRNRSNHNSGESGSECETVRPILKQSNSRENSPRPRLSFCNDDEELNINISPITTPRSPDGFFRKPKSVRRSHTVADADLSSIINLKKSFEDGASKDEALNNKVEPHIPKRPISVFEMVMNFEKSSEAGPSTGAIPKRSSLKGSRKSGRFLTQPITFDELEATAR